MHWKKLKEVLRAASWKMVEKLSLEEFGEWLRGEKMSDNVVELFRGEIIHNLLLLRIAGFF